MFKISGVGGLGLIAAGLVGLGSGPAAAQGSAPSPVDHRSCFFIHEWQGWKSPAPMAGRRLWASRPVPRLSTATGPQHCPEPAGHITSVVPMLRGIVRWHEGLPCHKQQVRAVWTREAAADTASIGKAGRKTSHDRGGCEEKMSKHRTVWACAVRAAHRDSQTMH